ncbi:hypothetical protein B9Z55_012423 [Caenorhabditis nigoni]|uniref:Uncharacterized protein n=1 Tax=Caenorhabditis nigoni TaxID=1611254 RepID=A0A2G5TXB2_9PELO|nr:hypothetical protein B9Z55_012423 [Caenorhabditis nigoni]
MLLAFAGSGSAYSIRPHIAASYCELELKKLEICKKFILMPKFTNETEWNEAVGALHDFTVCVGDDAQCTQTQLKSKLFQAIFRFGSKRSQMYQCLTNPLFEQIRKSCPGKCSDVDHWNCVIGGLKNATACSDDQVGILYDDMDLGLLNDSCQIIDKLRYEMKVLYEKLKRGSWAS